MKNVVLVTEGYPYSGVSADNPYGLTEPSFIHPEIEELAARFDRVIIMPTKISGEAADLRHLPNVEVSDFWATHPDWRRRWRRVRFLFEPGVWRETRGSGMRESLAYSAGARAFAGAMRQWMKREGLSAADTLFYSFWFDFRASGIGLLAEHEPVTLVARAHGYDFYMDCARPLRQQTLHRMRRLYVASQAGVDHLGSRFEGCDGKVRREWLGNLKPEYDTMTRRHKRIDGEVTFLSCARVCDDKNVERNLEFMTALAKARPGTRINWIHVGDGDRMASLRNAASGDIPANLHVDLRGALTNSEVYSIYRNEKIDWGMLLSRTEGGAPVAVCEALSYGVPVVATDCGGTADIVNDETGILLPPDCTPEEFVRGMVPYLDSDYRSTALRESAFRYWEKNFDARELRRRFVDSLVSIAE